MSAVAVIESSTIPDENASSGVIYSCHFGNHYRHIFSVLFRHTFSIFFIIEIFRLQADPCQPAELSQDAVSMQTSSSVRTVEKNYSDAKDKLENEFAVFKASCDRGKFSKASRE